VRVWGQMLPLSDNPEKPTSCNLSADAERVEIVSVFEKSGVNVTGWQMSRKLQ